MSATVPETAPPSEKRLADVLEHKFFLRLHMTAILTATILVGLGTTRGLYMLHVNVFWIRYGLAVITAYIAFIGFVKLWLLYIGMRSESNWLDSIGFNSSGSTSWSSSSSSSGSSSSSFSSSGGKFGGGGSSGSWAEGGSGTSSRAAAVAVPVATQRGVTPTPKSSSSSSVGSKSSSKSGGGGGGGDDLGELILIVLIIALVVAIVASFIWLVWAAPGILSETAFNAALAGALTGHAHKASHGNWMGSVMKKTMLPFSLILVLSIAVGAWAQHYCPNAIRLHDALPCVK